MTDREADKTKWTPIIGCSAIGVLGVTYAFCLRYFGLISREPAFLGFTCLFIFTAVIVYALPQLQELAFGGWTVTLREAEKRKYAREEKVRELMLTLADLTVT
jgi:hypothetical protein